MRKISMLAAANIKNLSARISTAFFTRSSRTASVPAGQGVQKATLISMVRNEKSILEVFCAHALSLFDRIILIDHLSTDGTGEYVKLLSEKYPNIEYYLFEEPGYYQSELMTWIAKNLVSREMPGWVFFLDADEFLPFKSKQDFALKLSELNSFPVISMPWLNLVPLDMESGQIIDGFFLKPPTGSRHYKIAFQPNLVAPDDYVVAQGNHVLLPASKRSKKKFSGKKVFPIYHIPIRTKQQLREKIIHGVESYRRMSSDRTANLGFHWEEIYQIMEARNLTNEMMAGIAARYGEPLNPPYERGLEKLRADGYIEMRMDVCSSPLTLSFHDLGASTDETGNSSNQLKGSKKISFDPLTRSMQLNS